MVKRREKKHRIWLTTPNFLALRRQSRTCNQMIIQYLFKLHNLKLFNNNWTYTVNMALMYIKQKNYFYLEKLNMFKLQNLGGWGCMSGTTAYSFALLPFSTANSALSLIATWHLINEDKIVPGPDPARYYEVSGEQLLSRCRRKGRSGSSRGEQ